MDEVQFQNRVFLLLLDDNPQHLLVKKLLESPLGLAKEIIRELFTDNFVSLKSSLDKIKKFVGGVTRAEVFANDYTLAHYYPYMFAFHQFFNSSFRARQGKVLEEILRIIVKDYSGCDTVPEKVKDAQQLLGKIIGSKPTKLDVDVTGIDNRQDKVILIQIRSRDDTGGTTAKTSLVEFLKYLLEQKTTPTKNILYLIAVWDERNAQQKNSTIEKFYSALKHLTAISKETFFAEIVQGFEVAKNISLQLAYGTEEIMQAIYKWSGNKDKKTLQSLSQLVTDIENWDDLWLAYSVANLELERKSLSNISNVELLTNKLKKHKLSLDFSSYKTLTNSINQTTITLSAAWKEDSIPLKSIADKMHYIRDLIFLYACFMKPNS